jgi:hypothetical protein
MTKFYLLFDYGIFDDRSNGFAHYLGSFDSYSDAETHYIKHYSKLKTTDNTNFDDSREHGFYIWCNHILYLYVYNRQNQPTLVQQKTMVNTFTKRYLYHPVFFMNGVVGYEGVLFESDDLVDCQEDLRFDIFWDWDRDRDETCDEFSGDIICFDTVLDTIFNIKIYNKNESFDTDTDTDTDTDGE